MEEERHPLIPLNLIRSEGFQGDFKELFGLTVEQMKELANACQTERGFEIPEGVISDLSNRIGADFNRIVRSIRVVSFLYEHARVIDMNVDEAVEKTCEFAINLKIEGCEEKKEGINYLLAPKVLFDKQAIIEETRNAIMPTLSYWQVECDARPVRDKKTGELLGYIPMILMGLELEGTSKDRWQFQITEKELNSIISNLNKVKELLATLKRDLDDKIIDTLG